MAKSLQEVLARSIVNHWIADGFEPDWRDFTDEADALLDDLEAAGFAVVQVKPTACHDDAKS